MVRRNRVEKLAFARLLGEFVKAIPGVSSEVVESMLGAYANVLTHAVYQAPPERKKATREKENKELLNKVDRMTVPDEQMPPPPQKRRRARSRR